MYSSAAEVALVPPGVLTVTCTVPEPAGEVAVTFVADSAFSAVALVEPNLTSLAPVRFVPGDRHGGAAGGRAAGRFDFRDGGAGM